MYIFAIVIVVNNNNTYYSHERRKQMKFSVVVGERGAIRRSVLQLRGVC